jgi:large subunit ribosomal protein L1
VCFGLCRLPSTAPAAFASKSTKGGPAIKARRGFTYFPDEGVKLVKAAATANFDEVRLQSPGDDPDRTRTGENKPALVFALIRLGRRPFPAAREQLNRLRCENDRELLAACRLQSIDISIQLGVDPRRAGENIRGVAQLPHGTGKTVRVAVFARDAKAAEAEAAGADIVGAEDLLELILAGNLQADKVIATPDVMPLVGRVARVLGPRGLMPNPKLGTVTMDVGAAVTNAKKGQVGFRVEKNGILHAPLGRASFEDEAILANLRALVLAINSLKPESIKGEFFRHATMSSTMGPGVPLDVMTIDPARAKFGHRADSHRDPTLNTGTMLRVAPAAVVSGLRQ